MKHLLPGRYLLLQGGTYDLTEGHMVHFISYDKFLFRQHMEAVIIITIQNDDQGEEKMMSHFSVDKSNIPPSSPESYEDL